MASASALSLMCVSSFPVFVIFLRKFSTTGNRHDIHAKTHGPHSCFTLLTLVLFAVQEDGPRKIISYWHPNLTINVLDDQTNWPYEEVPPPLNECEHLVVFYQKTREDRMN